MDDEPPRLRHNRELAMAYIRENKVYSRYPKVTEQIETVPFDVVGFPPFAYNPSIVSFGGINWMAYRYHEQSLSTKIGLCSIDKAPVVQNVTMDIPDAPSAEDPKLFVWGNELFMSFVVSRWPDMAKSVVRYGRVGQGSIDYGKVLDITQPQYANVLNDFSDMEKNWVFFENPGGYDNHGGQLHVIYRSGVTQKIYIPSLIETLNSPRWPYGLIKGGTVPLPYDGKWLRFFHSTLDNELNPQRRRYYIGALLMEPTPPFDCIRVSRKPILYGSEVDNLTKEQRKSCQQWKPQVVFPGGVIRRDNSWWLSVGVNDSACVICNVKPENLNL